MLIIRTVIILLIIMIIVASRRRALVERLDELLQRRQVLHVVLRRETY